jgi:hypothetical protein
VSTVAVRGPLSHVVGGFAEGIARGTTLTVGGMQPSPTGLRPAYSAAAKRPPTSDLAATWPEGGEAFCSLANNELKPGQRQPLPKKPRASSGRRLPGPGFQQIIAKCLSRPLLP